MLSETYRAKISPSGKEILPTGGSGVLCPGFALKCMGCTGLWRALYSFDNIFLKRRSLCKISCTFKKEQLKNEL
jgi:hypothetical protein